MVRKTRTPLTTGFLLCALSCIFLPGAAALAQNGMPPLIDREVLFGSSEIAGAQISPDGKFTALRLREITVDPETVTLAANPSDK